MNKKFLLLVLLMSMSFAAEKAFAGTSQWDLSLQVPFYAGMKLGDDFIGVGRMDSYSGASALGYLFLLPDIKWHYYFNLGPKLKLGAGLQLWTLILESVVFPRIALEFEAGKFVFQGGVGGGLFFLFGFFNHVLTGAIIIPELSAAYKFGKAFRIGIGVTTLHSPELSYLFGFNKDDFLLLSNVFVRWTL